MPAVNREVPAAVFRRLLANTRCRPHLFPDWPPDKLYVVLCLTPHGAFLVETEEGLSQLSTEPAVWYCVARGSFVQAGGFW